MEGLHQHLAGSVHNSDLGDSDRRGTCEGHKGHTLRLPKIDTQHITVSGSFWKRAPLKILFGIVQNIKQRM